MDREEIERDTIWETTATMTFQREKIAEETGLTSTQVIRVAKWLIDQRASADPIFMEQLKKFREYDPRDGK